MKKVFKAAIFSLSALALPLALSATARADALIKDSIDTTLEYQVNASGDSMRFISTMVLNDSKTLNDITKIDMDFKLTKSGQDDKDSVTKTTTKVYESISGENGKAKVDNTYYAVLTITDLTTFEGWRITPTFTYTFADNSTEEATASSWIIGNARLYFVKTNDEWDNDIHAYMFGSESTNANWPGKTMAYDSLTNMYYYDYALGERFTTVIFNDGTKQTSDITLSDTYDYYIQNVNEASAHPTASHSFVTEYNANQHWNHCTICGDNFDYKGHNLTASIDENTGIKHITCSECGFEAKLNPNIFYFTAPDNWNNVKVHLWVEGGVGTTWPGEQASYVGLNEFGQKIYSIDTTGYEKMIFNNDNNGSQTVNILIADCGAYNGIYCDWDHTDNGKPYPGYYIYIPENYSEE